MEDHFGCAIADITTGDCFLYRSWQNLRSFGMRSTNCPCGNHLQWRFFLWAESIPWSEGPSSYLHLSTDNWYFDDSLCQRTLKEHFHVNTLEGWESRIMTAVWSQQGHFFQYLTETQKTALSHMASDPTIFCRQIYADDSSSRRNLELVETSRENRSEVLFLWVLIRPELPWEPELLRGYVSSRRSGCHRDPGDWRR